MLELSLQNLKRENKALREKLEITEINMQTFMREMDGLFDQHQLSHMMEEMMIGAELEGPKNDEEGGGSTGGSIRRNK